MDNVSSEPRPASTGFALGPVVDPQRTNNRAAGLLQGQASSGLVFGGQGSGPPAINFSSRSAGASSQAFDYGSYSSRSNVPLADDDISSVIDSALGVSDGIIGSEKLGDIFSGFFQGENGNCATISAIKAALQHFGQSPTALFKDVKRDSNGARITMLDGVTVELTNQELEKAAKHSAIKGNNPAMVDLATLAYAASAKRAQNENHENSGQSFDKALDSLKNGEQTKEAFARLGMKDHIRLGTLSELQSGKVGTIDKDVAGPGTTHSMAVIDGVEERWGKKGGGVTEGTVQDPEGRVQGEYVLILV